MKTLTIAVVLIVAGGKKGNRGGRFRGRVGVVDGEEIGFGEGETHENGGGVGLEWGRSQRPG